MTDEVQENTVETVAEPKKKPRAVKDTPKNTGLLGALIKAQSEFPSIPKNHTNPFTKSKYADLSDIITTIRPVLNRNGIGIKQLINTEANGELSVESIVFNAQGEELSSGLLTFAIGQGGNQYQNKGIAVTYARRYTLCALLGIVADDDTDAELKSVKDTHIDGNLKMLAESACAKGLAEYQKFYASLKNDERLQLINSGLHEEIKKKLGA